MAFTTRCLQVGLKCARMLTGSQLNLQKAYRQLARGGPSHGHRQHAQKSGKDRACGSGDILADRQTDRQTHSHAQTYSSSSQYFASAAAGEVITIKELLKAKTVRLRSYGLSPIVCQRSTERKCLWWERSVKHLHVLRLPWKSEGVTDVDSRESAEKEAGLYLSGSSGGSTPVHTTADPPACG